MNEIEILDIFKESNALLEGHFVLSSGLHSAQYLQCALILQELKYAQKVCAALAEKFKEDKPTVVIGPALGGVIVSYEVGRALGVRSIFAERQDGKMTLRRGFQLGPKDKVLVVEDVITTGGSTKEVIELVEKTGAKVIGVGAIVDRSGSKEEFSAKFKALLKIDVQTFEPKNCPLCKSGKPLVKPGSRGI